MTPELQEFLRLAPIGLLVGAYGTLVGAGGGSVLVPVLLMMLPDKDPSTITGISLAVVFFNAYSGTIAYMRMGRIDYRAGTLFTLAGLPGAVLGVMLVHNMDRAVFNVLFGILLLLLGGYLVVSPLGSQKEGEPEVHEPPSDRRMLVGAVGSSYIGVLSSLLGIGGGVIHVPFLIRALKLPAHVATATSHFVLAFMALTGTVVHGFMGELDHGVFETLSLSVGVMMGAPIGASISTKLRGSLIMRLLALALCLVGVRLLWP